MKQCPRCKREYEDDSLRFCLEDGTALAPRNASEMKGDPTLVLPAPEPGQATISQVAAPRPEARKTVPDVLEPTQASVSQRSPAPGTVRIVIAVLMVIGVIVNVIGWGAWGFITMRRIPLMLLFLGMMLFAMVRANRHPKVSLLVGLALGFDLIETFVYLVINRSLFSLESSANITNAQLQSLSTVLAVLDDFGLAMILILLTAAVLTGRKSVSQTA
jgi:hypothetical protein